VNTELQVRDKRSVPATRSTEPRPRRRARRADGAARPDLPPGTSFALDVRDLGVRYDLRFTRKTTMRDTVARLFRRKRDGGKQQFWALRDVTFRIERGESVGVIGPNGAGKSTLLLVLAGIIQPSAGQVAVNGHISTLLSLQAGFDQDLTGRENIALAGALLGVEHREMERRTEGIIEFADIGAFIDAPLKTYSAGMRAKLGFSIATAVDPDILLLDEVLQTGDEVFREKSRARIIEILGAAKAVVLVTHDMRWVREFCTRAILIERGRIVADGDPDTIVDLHLEHSAQRKRERQEAIAKMRAGEIAVESLRGHRARRRSASRE
jgi:ABC-type polysaccharide/polyol phosphate transport system ATPase subunit